MRTLPAEVVARLIVAMTGYAVGRTSCAVIEGGILPVRSVVALITLPAEVVARPIVAMTSFAVCRTCCTVIEGRIPPIAGVMA